MPAVRKALTAPQRNCDTGKTPSAMLEEYIRGSGLSSPNQIAALCELAMPVVEWLVMPAERTGLPDRGEQAPVPPEAQS